MLRKRIMWFHTFSFIIFASVPFASSMLDGFQRCTYLRETNDTTIGKVSVNCNIKTLESNFSGLPIEAITKLNVQCTNPDYSESVLPFEEIQKLHDLQELVIKNCKIVDTIDKGFAGLTSLKKLTVNTNNILEGPSRRLILKTLSFYGLRALLHLDLGSNNINNVPVELFCPLSNLQVLNLTRNALNSSQSLGFGDGKCGDSELLVLDISFNELKYISSSAGFSHLRRLQHIDISFNKISGLSSESLSSLIYLRSFNMSNNALQELPQGLFINNKELREIHLQNNSIYSLGKGVFHRLEQLLVLDLSNNRLSSTHIDAGTFTGLIRLIVLDLSHNALTHIESHTFKDLFFLQILDLRNNSIGFIEDNAFLPLYNLHTLNIAENRLNVIGPLLFNGLYVLSKLTLNNNLLYNIDSKAFVNCSALKDLDISANALQQVPDAIRELTFLKNLDLGENQISHFQNGSFKNLDQLTGLRLIDNNIENLTRGMLWDLPNLQVLNLAKNKIQVVEINSFERNTQLEAIRLDQNFLENINGIFSTLTSLLWLNLSENHLVWFDFAFIPSSLKWLDIHGNYIVHLANYYKIQDEIKIKTLDASHNRIKEINPMSIPNTVELLFVNNNFIKQVHPNTFFRKTNLARMDMYANDLENLSLSALRLQTVPNNRSLPEIYLGGNPFKCDCNMEWLHRINNMSSTRQYPRLMDTHNIMCSTIHTRNTPHLQLSQTKSKDFLCTYETHCFALCRCCEFDACDCEMTCPMNCTCYHDQTWNTNIVDCSRQNVIEVPARIPMDATEVYLDGNSFKELLNHVFIGRKNMRVLFVNSSQIESIQNRTFNGLTALETLHLENNNIFAIKGFEFEHLVNLKELYLENNRISYISNVSFANLKSLEILHLDGNNLNTYPVWQLSVNNYLVELTISNNKWSCSCDFFRKLTQYVNINSAKVIDISNILCFKDSKQMFLHKIDFNKTICHDYYVMGSVLETVVSQNLPLFVVIFGAVIFILLFCVFWFIFGNIVKVWCFSRYKVRLCNIWDVSTKENEEKLYDAFVCYSPKDEEWVVQCFARELEPFYQLCLHYRDLSHVPFMHQTNSAIQEANESSCRLIMVLTRNFLQTEWSRFEFRESMHDALKGKVFKLIILEEGPLPEAELDPELRPYLKSAIRLKWGQKWFWEKLRYQMPYSENKTKIKSNVDRKINNYTFGSHTLTNSSCRHTLGERSKPTPHSPPDLQIYEPPVYSGGLVHDMEDTNYSSATTATPSPRSARRIQEPRPLSEHIYSSIDSDYSTLETSGKILPGHPWRPHVIMQPGSSPAYLV